MMDDTLNKHQLWKSFLDSDLEAWEQLFKLCYEDLYGYGLKLSSRPELTRDCIHELFVILWDRRENLGEVESVKAYLLASLRRSLLKRIQEKRRYFVNWDGEVHTTVQIQFSPEEIIIRDEMKLDKRQALHEALNALPDRQKEVLYLKYFNGMSYDEIEEILAINYQSIRNHIHRAVKRLRTIMDDHLSDIAISLLPFLLLVAL
ncbi:RNA polymerase sigma factor [Fodinibius sediminis]|uniref:RNA polymerase sigma factor, sigma-70 family n=1 Tax=Fodinibius sediminis TaxID=1214077 RepID=A0A521DE63_9BACT|nr:sigma-70 family RNA polymerase sigma factor [Fodinibius sediminis]SMO69933.1 RNA polymerase sigma factor, sigma-70 family [Fodinibius sediminis]